MRISDLHAVVEVMRSQCPDWLNRYEDYLDMLLDCKAITWEESMVLWKEALRSI